MAFMKEKMTGGLKYLQPLMICVTPKMIYAAANQQHLTVNINLKSKVEGIIKLLASKLNGFKEVISAFSSSFHLTIEIKDVQDFRTSFPVLLLETGELSRTEN